MPREELTKYPVSTRVNLKIWKIEVEDFPAFILVDDKGNDFFKQLKPWCPMKK